MRRFIFFCLCLPILSACGRGEGPTERALLAEPIAQGEGSNEATFSFSHVLNLVMDETAIKPRFERTKERCLKDAGLHCRLLSASYNSWTDADGDTYATGRLSVALSHDKIAAFETELLSPVVGEKSGDATVRSRSVTAENVSADARDVSKKLAQLTDYHDRLVELSKRPGIGIEGLIKVESELSRIQGQLDQLESEKADVDQRVSEERISIKLAGRDEASSIYSPSARVWRHSMHLLGDSAANALQFAIQIIPWLPLIAGAFFLFTWLWRVVRRRSSVASSSATKSDVGDRHGAQE